MTIRPSESVFIRFRSPMTTMFQSGTGPSGSVMQSSLACAFCGALLAPAPDDPNATTNANTTVNATTARTGTSSAAAGEHASSGTGDR